MDDRPAKKMFFENINMNIGISANYLEGKRTGVARYLANLLENWSRDFPGNKYYLYFQDHISEDLFLKNECFIKTIVKPPASFLKKWIFWENLFLARYLAQQPQLDIFFSPSYTLPLYTPCPKKVVSIFDIYYTVHPEWVSLRNRYTLGPLSHRAAKIADVVLTSSEFDKRDIVKFYTVPENKVKVIPLAAEEKFKPLRDSNAVRQVSAKYDIREKFILAVGHIINRRVQDRVIRAFARFHKTHPDVDLVLVGANKSYPYLDIQKIIQDNNLSKNVRWIRYLPEEDLVSMYNAAEVFVYLSLYEGEGIPLKEAMACGVPVITSPALKEVVEGAGYIVDEPLSEDGICIAMEQVMFDEKLRLQLIKDGIERAKIFSWGKCARETMEVFKTL